MKDKSFFKGLITGALSVIGLCVLALGVLKIVNVVKYGPGTGNVNINEIGVGAKISEIESIIDNNTLYDVDSSKLETYLYKGLISGLGDKYAAYYTKEENESVNQSYNGEYRGIGITFSAENDGNIVIQSVYKGCPADRAGLKAKDHIVSINGTKYESAKYMQVASDIRNCPEDSAKFEIYRPSTSETFTVDIPIEKIVTPVVEGEMKEGNIGYIAIKSFNLKTDTMFKETYESLEQQGMKGIILDLRGNPGGLVSPTLQMLDYLLPEGNVLVMQSKDGKKTAYKSGESAKLNIPCVVLIDESSASAAEIFAGAMKDFKVATIMGVKSYGKGIVQNTYTLSDGTAVKLTIAKYFTPSGADIHEKGIEPDVTVEKSAQGDLQLDEAVKTIKSKI